MESTKLINLIGESCEEALAAEVSATPKPGLVDKNNSGAHRDMDFTTFMDSISAISPAFFEFARLGTGLETLDENSLAKIRPLGIKYEKAMFDATKGVNTHKGAIFSLGIIAAAAGHCGFIRGDLQAETVCAAASIIAGAVEGDFKNPPKEKFLTKGYELFTKYGIRGIRGEAADGFPSVRQRAIHELRELMSQGKYSENEMHLQTLLCLMTTATDTNVIARCGGGAIKLLQSEAKKILEHGGALTQRGILELYALDQNFIEKNISPGGCADLLSVTIALCKMEDGFIKMEGKSNA